MSTLRWIGASLNKRQTYTITVANTWAQNDTVTLTIDSVDFTITIGTLVTTAQVATTIKEFFNGSGSATDTSASATISMADGGASAIPQFSELTASVSGSVVTLTTNQSGALSGKPFTISVTESTAGTGTATGAAGITATSQYHASEADNWSGNAVPADGDVLIFDSGSVDMRWDLATYASGATTCQPLTITKYKSYSGNIGLAEYNADSTSDTYHEYRTTYFTTDDNTTTTTANVEVGEGTGSKRFYWNAGAGQAVLNLFDKGTRADTGVPCVLFKGTHASNVVNNLRGDVGIAFFGGETATVATLVTGDGSTSQANTVCGSGCTLTTVTLNGGTQETNSAMTTANQYGGTWVHKSGTVTTANISAGTHYPNGGATYTTLNLFGGTFDASKGNASFTIGTLNMYKGAKFIDPQGRAGNVAFTLKGCSLADVTIVIPPGKTVTLS